MATDCDAGLGALLANDDVEVIVGRGRWGDSWHKIVVLNNRGLLHSMNYCQDHACRIVGRLYNMK